MPCPTTQSPSSGPYLDTRRRQMPFLQVSASAIEYISNQVSPENGSKRSQTPRKQGPLSEKTTRKTFEPDLEFDNIVSFWATLTKASNVIQNGKRLENISWRLINRKLLLDNKLTKTDFSAVVEISKGNNCKELKDSKQHRRKLYKRISSDSIKSSNSNSSLNTNTNVSTSISASASANTRQNNTPGTLFGNGNSNNNSTVSMKNLKTQTPHSLNNSVSNTAGSSNTKKLHSKTNATKATASTVHVPSLFGRTSASNSKEDIRRGNGAPTSDKIAKGALPQNQPSNRNTRFYFDQSSPDSPSLSISPPVRYGNMSNISETLASNHHQKSQALATTASSKLSQKQIISDSIAKVIAKHSNSNSNSTASASAGANAGTGANISKRDNSIFHAPKKQYNNTVAMSALGKNPHNMVNSLFSTRANKAAASASASASASTSKLTSVAPAKQPTKSDVPALPSLFPKAEYLTPKSGNAKEIKDDKHVHMHMTPMTTGVPLKPSLSQTSIASAISRASTTTSLFQNKPKSTVVVNSSSDEEEYDSFDSEDDDESDDADADDNDNDNDNAKDNLSITKEATKHSQSKELKAGNQDGNVAAAVVEQLPHHQEHRHHHNHIQIHHHHHHHHGDDFDDEDEDEDSDSDWSSLTEDDDNFDEDDDHGSEILEFKKEVVTDDESSKPTLKRSLLSGMFLDQLDKEKSKEKNVNAKSGNDRHTAHDYDTASIRSTTTSGRNGGHYDLHHRSNAPPTASHLLPTALATHMFLPTKNFQTFQSVQRGQYKPSGQGHGQVPVPPQPQPQQMHRTPQKHPHPPQLPHQAHHNGIPVKPTQLTRDNIAKFANVAKPMVKARSMIREESGEDAENGDDIEEYASSIRTSTSSIDIPGSKNKKMLEKKRKERQLEWELELERQRLGVPPQGSGTENMPVTLLDAVKKENKALGDGIAGNGVNGNGSIDYVDDVIKKIVRNDDGIEGMDDDLDYHAKGW